MKMADDVTDQDKETTVSKVEAACAAAISLVIAAKVKTTITAPILIAIMFAVVVTGEVAIVTPKPPSSSLQCQVSMAYVVNSGSNTVSVIATDKNRVVATISVGTSPFAVAVTLDGKRAYVTNSGNGTVSVIDTVTNSVLTTIPVMNAFNLYGVAVSSDDTLIYVVYSTHVNGSSVGRNMFSAIDTITNQIMFTIPGGTLVGISPPVSYHIVVHPDGTRAYVTGAPAGLLVVDTVKKVQLNVDPVTPSFGIAITPDGTQLYLTFFDSYDEEFSGAGVSIINTATNQLKASIQVPGGDSLRSPAVAVSPDGKRVYLASYYPRSIVTVIDTATNLVLEYIPIDSQSTLFGVAVSVDGTKAYVTDNNHRSVFVIDAATNKVIGDPILVGSVPRAIATAWIPC
jgi:YVTN family beta-propeller protein